MTFQKNPKKPTCGWVFLGFFKRVFLGFFGWVFLGGFFNANPAHLFLPLLILLTSCFLCIHHVQPYSWSWIPLEGFPTVTFLLLPTGYNQKAKPLTSSTLPVCHFLHIVIHFVFLLVSSLPPKLPLRNWNGCLSFGDCFLNGPPSSHGSKIQWFMETLQRLPLSE